MSGVQATAPEESLLGLVLQGKYRVVRLVGQGGMGVVYEAEHTQLGKRVAIKLMLQKYMHDAEALARFSREAYAASQIGNPHIVDVSDIGEAPDGRSFVVMELLQGMSLSQAIEQGGAMSPWRAIHIMRQVLRAVGAAHAKGIVHRDLKPDNVFLVDQGDQRDFVKLLDFGISKVMDQDSIAATRLTTTGVVMGTPLYMAPEQALGNPVGHQADVYACGVMLYEMLAGKPPFEGATYAVLVAKLLTAQPPWLGEVRAGLPISLVNAVHRALEKDPVARFQSAEMFAASLPGDRSPSQIELAGTLQSGMAPAVVPLPAPKAKWPWYVLGTILVAGAAATAAVLILNKPPAEANPQPLATPPVRPVPAPVATAPAAKPDTGTLEVKSSPTGAMVSVDSQPAGVTPIVVTLAPGGHHLHIELEGHLSLDEDEDVRAGERTSVVVPLPEAPAAPVAQKAHGTPPAHHAKPPATVHGTVTHTVITPGSPTITPSGPAGPPTTPGGPDNPYDEPNTTTPPPPPPPPPPGGKPDKTKPNPY